ncbi:RHS repeat-associated core domain-containing protein [Streptacidiphilus sp. ASG 303]|uniref:RHS repeat domain-containing protein n=1 Tax=Streptacidiphilus sp. ASG 303 TaxID=2896847 RepID=UPI0027E17418|nr:RHS repeat-associated core domain-containing protein [Streptacidiphilus sp. ASG 303]
MEFRLVSRGKPQVVESAPRTRGDGPPYTWEVWDTGKPSTASRWTAQPTWNTRYATSTETKGNPGCASQPDGWINADVTSLAQAWAAAGNASSNMGLRGSNETVTSQWKRVNSANAASNPPTLVVTYNRYPAADTPTMTPDGGLAGGALGFTNSLTSKLSAKVSDPDGGNVTGLFDLYDYTSGSDVLVQSGITGTTVTSGGTSTATVAAGKLVNGHKYKVRAKAKDATGALSPTFSADKLITVDTTAPGRTAISSSDFPAGAWSGTPDASGTYRGTFTFTPPTGDVHDVIYNLDGGTWHSIPSTGQAVSTGLPFTSGKHTLTVRTRDNAANLSATPDTAYTFYAGSGAALNAPGDGERPARRTGLSSQGKPSDTGVTYQYRRGAADTWHDVPVADTRRTSDGTTPSAWPLPVTGGVPADLSWNITDSLAADGPVDVRAVFTDGTLTDASDPHTVTVDRNAGTAPSDAVGPGQVNDLTGDYTLSGTDASAFDLSVSRTFSSRRPTAGADATGQAAIFGPQWSAGTTAEITDSDWAYVRTATPTSLALVDAEGDETGFTLKDAAAGTWTPEPGSEDLTLTGKTGDATLVLKDTEGTTTTFTKPAGASTWQLATSRLATANSTTTVVPDVVQTGGKVRPKYVIAPTSAIADPATCQATPATKGCRMLEYVYATATTAAGSTLGDYAGQVKQIKLWATTPGDSASTTTVVTQYAYDASGRLREVWDPRISPALKTAYTYDANGRVTTLTPPGELPWTFTYAKVGSSAVAGEGMLLDASRPTLTPGSATQTNGTATTSVVYNVPLTGTKAPNQMGIADVAAWGQSDAPTDATAVFPADQVPASHDGSALTGTDYKRATLSYTNASGREVNTAAPGGHLTTTAYDRYGNTVRELSDSNRRLALATSGTGLTEQQQLNIDKLPAADRADLLSTTSVYSADGQRELETFGPLHQVTLEHDLAAAGSNPALPAGTQAPARAHTVTAYDEGRPTDGSATVSDQPTTVTTGAWIDGYPGDADTRTSATAYDWVKGLPTSTVDDPSGLKITKTTAYDTQGRVTKTTLPKSNGTDAGATVTTYWSATGTGACNGRPEWADLVCSTGPAGAITGGGSNPAQLPTETTTYNRWGSPDTVTETANGVTRTTTTTYDAAGRATKTAVTGGTGTAVPDTTTTYDPATGDVATTASTSGTITTTYDALGRAISYADGSGNTTTTQYDALDRPVKATDSAPSTTTWTYDTAKDPRGVATSLTDSVAGTFTAAYDDDGDLATQTLPGGITQTLTQDEAGAQTGQTYTRTSDSTVLLADTADQTVHGQTADHAATTGGTTSQHYTYDPIGRLTRTDDTGTDNSCTRRSYGFDANTNRTSYATATSAPGSPCATGTAATLTYDSADRLITAGTVYDAFGRTTTQAGGNQLAYYTNDLVRSQTSGGKRQTWALDPAGRLASWTTETTPDSGTTWNLTAAKTNHYGNSSDSPDWTLENSTGRIVTRNVQDLTGDLAAVTSDTGSTVLQLTNIHGDVALQYPLDTAVNPTVLQADEYGNPLSGTPATRYGWLGAKQRSSETLTGLTLMGIRLYDPTAGRFLSVDPVPGGNANAYDYCTADPISCYDLDGRWGWRSIGKWASHHKVDIALTAVGFVPGVGALTWGYRAYRIVRIARAAKGMDGGIRASRATSWLAGRMWTGRGSRSFGKKLGRISRDGLRQWRRPQHKSDGHWKSNFQYRKSPKGKWKNNYHVYHRRWW